VVATALCPARVNEKAVVILSGAVHVQLPDGTATVAPLALILLKAEDTALSLQSVALIVCAAARSAKLENRSNKIKEIHFKFMGGALFSIEKRGILPLPYAGVQKESSHESNVDPKLRLVQWNLCVANREVITMFLSLKGRRPGVAGDHGPASIFVRVHCSAITCT
jgi:hypothetical protein